MNVRPRKPDDALRRFAVSEKALLAILLLCSVNNKSKQCLYNITAQDHAYLLSYCKQYFTVISSVNVSLSWLYNEL